MLILPTNDPSISVTYYEGRLHLLGRTVLDEGTVVDRIVSEQIRFLQDTYASMDPEILELRKTIQLERQPVSMDDLYSIYPWKDRVIDSLREVFEWEQELVDREAIRIHLETSAPIALTDLATMEETFLKQVQGLYLNTLDIQTPPRV
jgi:hypothetical protein